MRAILTVVMAAVLGVLVAWGATRREFPRVERPLATMISSPHVVPGQPKVVIDGSETHDFGAMEVYGTKSHVFLLRNVGDAPLELTKGSTTCKCTISELDEGAVPPGEAREVKLEWTPKSATDKFGQSAEIHTNDPVRRTVKLEIRGRVRDSLLVEPSTLALSQFTAAQPVVVDVKVWSFREEKWEMTSYECLEPAFTPLVHVETSPMTREQLAEQASAKNGQVLHVTIGPGMPLGKVQQTLRIQHTHNERGPLDINITGKAVGDISILGAAYSADRDFVELGNVAASKGASVKVYLAVRGEHRADTQIKLKSIDPAETLHVTLGEPLDRNAKSVLWPVMLEIPQGAAEANRVGAEAGKLARVEFETSHPDVPEIAIRVRMSVVGNE